MTNFYSNALQSQLALHIQAKCNVVTMIKYIRQCTWYGMTWSSLLFCNFDLFHTEFCTGVTFRSYAHHPLTYNSAPTLSLQPLVQFPPSTKKIHSHPHPMPMCLNPKSNRSHDALQMKLSHKHECNTNKTLKG